MLVEGWLAWQVYAGDGGGKKADDEDCWSLLSLWAAAAGLWMGNDDGRREGLVWDIERALPQRKRSNRS